MKHPIRSRATDALIGDEEQNGKHKRTKRKKQGSYGVIIIIIIIIIVFTREYTHMLD